MTKQTDDPLSRVLMALNQIRGADLNPVSTAALQTAQEALVDVQEERGALLGVIREAARLLTILDSYEASLEDKDQEQIARLTAAGAEAEEALAEALSHVPASADMDTALLGQTALLAVLDRFSEEEGE